MQVEKTVFISYRRVDIFHALAIYHKLQGSGFDVFYDYQSIKSGSFEQIILKQIALRAHFLVLLTPQALKRCQEPDDWLRREIEYAIDLKRNVVPLLFDQFSFRDAQPYLTGKLALLSSYNALRIPADYFAEAMERLYNDFLNIPLELVPHPIKPDPNATPLRPPTRPSWRVNLQTCLERGNMRYDIGDYDGAISAYTDALALNPRFAAACYNRGIARYNKGDIDGAIEDFTKAICLNPSYASIYFNRGIARQATGDLDGPIADFTEVIRLTPQDPNAYTLRGIIRRKQGDFGGALDDFTHAIDLMPQNVDAYYNRALVRSSSGNPDGAIADFNVVLQLDPNFTDAYRARGAAYEQKGDFVRANDDYQRYIALGGTEAKQLLEQIRVNANKLLSQPKRARSNV